MCVVGVLRECKVCVCVALCFFFFLRVSAKCVVRCVFARVQSVVVRCAFFAPDQDTGAASIKRAV